MPKVIATKTTAVRRTTANEKRTTKLLTSGPTHSRHVATVHDSWFQTRDHWGIRFGRKLSAQKCADCHRRKANFGRCLRNRRCRADVAEEMMAAAASLV